MGDHVSRETPSVPDAAPGVFSTRWSTAERYASLLATEGIGRGLLGPREVPRLWDRHLLNCALVTDVVPVGATVCDIGSGAGLPGLVMAIRRPDLVVTMVEPLLRRTTFLDEAVTVLGLGNAEVVRARAEELHGLRTFDVVTSRAVAPLERLAQWSIPLARVGGHVVAMKGDSAAEELARARPVIERLGGQEPEVLTLSSVSLSFPTTVVRVRAGGTAPLRLSRARSRTTSGADNRREKRR